MNNIKVERIFENTLLINPIICDCGDNHSDISVSYLSESFYSDLFLFDTLIHNN